MQHNPLLYSADGHQELERFVDEDIAEFEQWFCRNVDTNAVALLGPEKAILKTYLWYKIHSDEERPDGTPRSG